MNIAEIDYTAYAQLLVEIGVGLQPGEKLLIRHEPEGALLARSCAEYAYAAGAKLVHQQLRDPHVTKARVEAQIGNEEALNAAPGWLDEWQKTVTGEGWASLALISHEESGLMADTNQEALGLYERLQSKQMHLFRNAVTSHKIPWCVASVPGDKWAQRVLGKEKTAQDLWRILVPILLLDKEKPVAAWKDKSKFLHKRTSVLNNLNLKALHFEDEGTDLVIGLLKKSRWLGGGKYKDDRMYIANLPTEEVFTTPDRMICNGRVRAKRPVEVRGTVVKGASFTFEDGIVKEFDADSGRDALSAFLDTDLGSRRLGEVALVDESSPIAQTRLVFGSILYDENASCHIALGSGYPNGITGGENLDTSEKRIKAGCNVSLVHLDFMIGSPQTSVTGFLDDGRKIPIMRDGLFVREEPTL